MDLTRAKKGWKSNFFSISQKGPTNKKFLFLNISNSNRNSALPHMSPTYPEKMSLLGPSSWEEIAHVRTYRRTDRPQEFTPLLTRLRILHAISFYQFFLPNSLTALGSWIITSILFSPNIEIDNGIGRHNPQKHALTAITLQSAFIRLPSPPSPLPSR